MGRLMSKQTVAVAADHAGYALKETLKRELERLGYHALDLGTHGPESVDYPDFADSLAAAMADGRADRGVAICGSGIGISIAANRYPHVRAALVHGADEARLARQHNDANVLALGARFISDGAARESLVAFLETPFEGGRHERRVAKLARTSSKS